jgi:hypothetical protein
MSDLIPIIIVVAFVIALAYWLGTYLRRRSDLPPQTTVLPAAPRTATPPLLAAVVGDRETRAVVGWLLSQAFEQTGINVATDKLAYDRIFNAARTAIEELKTREDTVISLPFLTADVTGPKHLEARLTRAAIQELVRQ